MSTLILCANAYAWAMLRGLDGGVRGNDLIGAAQPDGATDILLVGRDSRVDSQGNPLPQYVLDELRAGDAEGDRTDTMILLRVPNRGGRASAISFPRDTKVQLDRGYGEHKLTDAYGLSKATATKQLRNKGVTAPKEQEKQSDAEAQKFLIQTLNKLAGVHIDHYAEVNLLGFYHITKAVGGIDICLKQPTRDPKSGADFRKGPQTIQGADALAFVRQREGPGMERSDLDRIVRQQVFMSSLTKKMLQAGTLSNPSRLSSLFGSLQQALVLDKNWDVLGFAQHMQGISGGNIEFQTAPVQIDQEGQVQLNPGRSARFAQNLLLPPQQRQQQEQHEERARQGRSATSVNVYNTTRSNGLAERVRRSLSAQGYDRGHVSNAARRPTSVVEHAPDDQEAARGIAIRLGGLPTRPNSDARSGTVAVYLGDNYRGPGKNNLAAAPTIRLDGTQKTPHSNARTQGATIEQQPITPDGIPCVS